MGQYGTEESIPNRGTRFVANLMVVITVLAGFTKLRFGAFGVSELCTVFLFIYSWWNRNRFCIGEMIFTQFWLLTIFLNCIGLFVNLFFQIDYSAIQSGAAWFDMSAFSYMLLLCFTFESILTSMSYNEIWALFRRIFFSSILIIGILFVVSRFRQTLFGISLLYGGARFSPLADNPHQISVLTSTLPFIGFRILKEARSLGSKVVILVFAATSMLVGLASSSDTLTVVYIVCFYLMMLIRDRSGRQKKPSYLPAVIVSLIILAVILCYRDWFVALIIGFFDEGDMGGVRFRLWRNSVLAGMHSPIFGLGPGSHAGFYGPFEGVESHQMLLTMFTQSGLIGVAVLAVLVLKILRTVYKDKYIFTMVVGLLIITLSGSALRRTVLWIYMMIGYHLVRRLDGGLPS